MSIGCRVSCPAACPMVPYRPCPIRRQGAPNHRHPAIDIGCSEGQACSSEAGAILPEYVSLCAPTGGTMTSLESSEVAAQLDQDHLLETNGRIAACRRCGARTDSPTGLHHVLLESQATRSAEWLTAQARLRDIAHTRNPSSSIGFQPDGYRHKVTIPEVPTPIEPEPFPPFPVPKPMARKRTSGHISGSDR